MRNQSLHRVYPYKIIQAKHKNGLFVDRIEARQMIELAGKPKVYSSLKIESFL